MDELFSIAKPTTSAAAVGTTTNLPEEVANSDLSQILSAISASLSIVGSVALISSYFAWKEIQTTSRKILVFISFSDLFTAAGNMFSILNPTSLSKELCEAQSFITTTSTLCSFFWTTYLGLYLFLSVGRRHFRLAENLMLVFHITSWGIPLAIVTTALVEHKLGSDKDFVTGGWCWINSNANDKLFWMLITGKAWEIAAYTLIAVLFSTIKCHIRREIRHHREVFITRSSLLAAHKADRKLTFIPVVFILLRIWGTIRFFFFICYPGFAHNKQLQKKLEFLVYLQGIGDSAQGFTNFLLYCFLTEKFQNKLKKIFKCWCNDKCCNSKSLPAVANDEESDSEKGKERNVSINNETTPLLDDGTSIDITPSITPRSNRSD